MNSCRRELYKPAVANQWSERLTTAGINPVCTEVAKKPGVTYNSIEFMEVNEKLILTSYRYLISGLHSSWCILENLKALLYP